MPSFLLVEMGSHYLCLGWPQTIILLISASQEARIIDVSHCVPVSSFCVFFFFFGRGGCFVCLFETVTHHVVQAGLEVTQIQATLLPQPPKKLRQRHVTDWQSSG
jgi:hypothetical protein